MQPSSVSGVGLAVPEPPAVEIEPLLPSARRRRLRQILRRPSSLLALAGVALLLVLAFFGADIAPYGPAALDLGNQYVGPSLQYLFGTDDLGRDIFSRVVVGAHYSLVAVVVVLSIALVVGALVGASAGYVGSMTDEVLMRVTDVFLASCWRWPSPRR